MKKEFTPTAMLCNKEQFEAIKLKLDRNGNEIFMIGKFEENTYLVLFDHGGITNGSEMIRENYIIHETWNERIFLQACGIETEETFEITKETIIKYKMKDEFPEVFDVKLEVGKWYKDRFNRLFCVSSTIDYKNCLAYGFGCITNNFIHQNGCAWEINGSEVKATKQEVFEALKNEAVKRGFVEGNYFIEPDNCVAHSYQKRLIKGSIKAYMPDNSMLCMSGNNSLIYKNGKWATIASTKTKEEAEKLLGVKIID